MLPRRKEAATPARASRSRSRCTALLWLYILCAIMLSVPSRMTSSFWSILQLIMPVSSDQYIFVFNMSDLCCPKIEGHNMVQYDTILIA